MQTYSYQYHLSQSFSSLGIFSSAATIIMRGHHHHAKAMDMDRTCDEKRARQHLPYSPSLDTKGETEARATQEHPGRRTVEWELKTLYHTWETVQKLAKNRQEWSTLLPPNMPAGITGMSVMVLLAFVFPHTTKQTALSQSAGDRLRRCVRLF